MTTEYWRLDGEKLSAITKRKGFVRKIFNHNQRAMKICTHRYWGIKACGELYQTKVAFAKSGSTKQEGILRECHSINSINFV